MQLIQSLNTHYGLEIFFVSIICYLIGSISFGVIITRITKIGDIRSIGSGNIGATNVLRTGNQKAAFGTLLLDGGKGYMAVLMINSFFEPSLIIFGGLSVFLGHSFPVFHGFKGGKGVATFFGVLLALNFFAALVVCIIWLLIAIFFRISSLSALFSSLAAPFVYLTLGWENIALITTLVALIWVRHISNIKRLITKNEPKISIKKAK